MTRKNARRLDGRVVAITGAARGIGLATATALHERGARVAIGDIDLDTATAAAKSLGPDVLALPLDVTAEESVVEFVAAAEDQLGPLDVLVNNAGIMPIGPFLEMPTALARRAVDINVCGVILGMKAALPGMLKRGSGHIVNVSSAAGKGPTPGGLTYAGTKAAVVALTETARVEYARTGVSFTCVMPSFTNTDLIAGTAGTKFIKNVEPAAVGEAIARAVARPRPDVYVPSVIGPIIKWQPLTGRRMRDWMNHRLGADRVFLDVNRDQRSEYDERIGG